MHQQRHWEKDHGHILTYKDIKDNTLSWNILKKRAKGPYSKISNLQRKRFRQTLEN